MRTNLMRYWIVFALLAVVSFFSLRHLLNVQSSEIPVDLSGYFPLALDGWQGEALDLEEGTMRLLGTDNALLHLYSPEDPSRVPVLLCITFTSGDHRITHPPEVCYEGQGWSIALKEEIPFNFDGTPSREIVVDHFQIVRHEEVQEVIAWFRTESAEATSFLHQKFEMLLGKLFRGGGWSAMIRLSAPVTDGDSDRSLKSIADFGALLLPRLDDFSRALEDR